VDQELRSLMMMGKPMSGEEGGEGGKEGGKEGGGEDA